MFFSSLLCAAGSGGKSVCCYMLHFLHSESKGLLYAVPISLCVCQSDTGFELGEGRAVHRVLTYVLCSVSPRINSWAHKASPPSD